MDGAEPGFQVGHRPLWAWASLSQFLLPSVLVLWTCALVLLDCISVFVIHWQQRCHQAASTSGTVRLLGGTRLLAFLSP